MEPADLPVSEPSAEGEAALRAGLQREAALRRELEETNQGLIALYAELEDARAAESRLAAIVVSSGDAMLSLARDRTISSWNDGAGQLLGFTEDETLQHPLDTLLTDASRGTLGVAFDRIASGERAAHFDAWVRRVDGSAVEVSVTLSAMLDREGGVIGWSAVLRDLTERRRTEAELAASEAAKQVLADRDRIARELHTHVIQRLFAAGLSAQAAAALVVRPEVAERIQAVVALLDQAIADLRSAIFRLPRPVRPGATLEQRIADLAANAAENLGYEPTLHFDADRDPDPPPHVVEEAVAVTEEALSNVFRHARASAVDIFVDREEDLVLRVVDDGAGVAAFDGPGSLRQLRERAAALGGTLDVQPRPGGGTRLEWRMPVRP